VGKGEESNEVRLVANLLPLRVTSAVTLCPEHRSGFRLGRLLGSRFRVTHNLVILVFNLLDRLTQKKVMRHYLFVGDHCEAIDVRKVACDQSQEGIAPLSSLGQLSSALVVHDVPTVRLPVHSQGMR